MQQATKIIPSLHFRALQTKLRKRTKVWVKRGSIEKIWLSGDQTSQVAINLHVTGQLNPITQVKTVGSVATATSAAKAQKSLNRVCRSRMLAS